jgi:serine/threonine protein kinase
MGDDGRHVPNHSSTDMIGSPCFASLRIHEGNRYSRRDDMISLGYIWFYLRGFSWNDIPSFEIERNCPKESMSPIHIEYPANRVLRYKKENIISFLYPERNERPVSDSPMKNYMEYVYRLDYEETPKYGPMKMLFLSD